MQNGNPCLAVKGLYKYFGSLAAVSDVDLEVAPGERRAIIGPNGAGKTTLFNLIAGQLRPSKGQVFFFGQDITRKRPYQRAYLGMARTYQITNLFPSLSVLYNLLLGIQALKSAKYVTFFPLTHYHHYYDQAQELLDRVGLLEKQDILVEHLPYGEQRLLELALALAGDPKLLLLDEPTSGLPPGEAKELAKVLNGVSSDMTILIIEHHMDVAFAIAESITVLNHGAVLADGGTDEIRSNAEVQKVYLGEEED